MLFSPFLSAISINGKDRLSEGNLMVIFTPHFKSTQIRVIHAWFFFVHYLFICIYCAKYRLPCNTLFYVFVADAVTRKAVETGTRLPQTQWSLTGRPCAAFSFSVFANREWVSEWVSVRLTKCMSDWVDEQAHGWASEQISPLPLYQTAQLGWLASYSPQCGNCGWLCVSGWGVSFPSTCALRGGHHLDRVCSVTGGSITRGSCWEYT